MAKLKPGRKVLVVDDDPDIRAIVIFNLQQAGCIVTEATDGLEALDAIRESAPDAMVLDVNMPNMDGFGVLTRMQEEGLGPEVRTLMLTARNDHDDVRRAIALGARDYLAKPFDGAQLVLRVARLLIRSRDSLNI